MQQVYWVEIPSQELYRLIQEEPSPGKHTYALGESQGRMYVFPEPYSVIVGYRRPQPGTLPARLYHPKEGWTDPRGVFRALVVVKGFTYNMEVQSGH
jgi:hypothetical protein